MCDNAKEAFDYARMAKASYESEDPTDVDKYKLIDDLTVDSNWFGINTNLH